MSEKFLYCCKVNSRHNELRGKGMSQVMEVKVIDLGFLAS